MIRLMKLSVMLLVFKTTTSREVRGPDLFSSNDAAREFFSLMDESDRPLYQGNVDVLELLRDAFPDADIPSSFYEAKKIINEIRLELRKNRCTPNDCMLYWGEDDRRRLVSVTLRGSRLFGKGRSEEETAKILRYFPLKPRTQRLFMSSKTNSRHMRWHEDDKNEDGKLEAST
ncbi:hypothetical protein K1719_013384 [Acacia pycnantha]|nr:hypothetical protein K1719_013384 [Acacia pycnantha]